MENPKQEWMITGGSHMTWETSQWSLAILPFPPFKAPELLQLPESLVKPQL